MPRSQKNGTGHANLVRDRVPTRERDIGNEPRRVPERLRLAGSALSRRTGLELLPGLPLAAWQNIGKQLYVISDAAPWWLGDWLVYGERQYADRYVDAVRDTGLDYQTLRNYAWVARRIPLSRRRDSLSFAHHAEVAALPVEAQDIWFNQALRNGWSRNELRRRLRRGPAAQLAGRPGADQGAAEKVAGAGGAAAEGAGTAPVRTLRVPLRPEQEVRWRGAAGRQGCALEDWIVMVLDQAASDGPPHTPSTPTDRTVQAPHG